MDDYEKYQELCDKLKEDNQKLLEKFESGLRASNLSEKVINKHLSYIDFYLNEFLLYEEPIEAKEGIYEIDHFFGYWFIKKCLQARRSTIKSFATTLKKFYTFMEKEKLVSKEDLKELKEIIKEDMPFWLDNLARYDDPDEPNWYY